MKKKLTQLEKYVREEELIARKYGIIKTPQIEFPGKPKVPFFSRMAASILRSQGGTITIRLEQK